WSAEIVSAIEECSIFIVLLSTDSVASVNVTKEVSLASESKKKIVPIEIYRCELNPAMKYALAGLQKVSINNEDALQRAFKKLGIGEEESNGQEFPPSIHAPLLLSKQRPRYVRYGLLAVLLLAGLGAYFALRTPTTNSYSTVKYKPKVIRVLVLPFQYLSGIKDDDFFADGLTGEMMSQLAKLKDVKLIDRQTAASYKGKNIDVKSLGKELGVNYVVEGTIQRQDKGWTIKTNFIDAQTGIIGLSHSIEGTTDNLKGFQKYVARTITFEFQKSLLRLSSVLDSLAVRNATTNDEAYSLFLSGLNILENSPTPLQRDKGESLLIQATTLDPKFIYPYYYRAEGYLSLYMIRKEDFEIGRNPRHLFIADSLSRFLYNLAPDFAENVILLARIETMYDSIDKAIVLMKKYIQIEPNGINAYAALGYLYSSKKQYDLAATYLEKAVEINIGDLMAYSMLVDCLHILGDTTKQNEYIDESMPLFEQTLLAEPMKTNLRNRFALMLAYNSKYKEQALNQIRIVLQSPNVSPIDHYIAASVYCVLGDTRRALEYLQIVVSEKFHGATDMIEDPNFKRIRNLPEFNALTKKAQANLSN
ncbi:MAG: TIR domain-containing protein, partial [Ignavibacteriota bacterium]